MEKEIMSLEQYEAFLKSVDWQYLYSDDMRAYSRGAQQVRDASEMLEEYKARGLGKEAEALYIKYKR